MVEKITKVNCYHCGSVFNVVKYGFNSNNGKQIHKYNDCDKYSRENPQYKKYSDNFKELIIGCYMESMSLRGIE